ncbi:hypothetical protein PHYBOEH_007611 [Phytophthora boehmeriae]|uniref:EGF-like domain-containing protein n=1 Tax=Phytophthora boehmeriae TaxID=109152 RepID=A0A8T1X206_9STRA|nr:hypothetical protein PHYBOEH_007611 [Phytophthora boehmeriae]
MTKWWLVAVLALLPSVVFGACPNKCSGHGTCTLNDVCVCQQNWVGGDCSGRLCPFTRAWHDTAQRNDDAHYYAECGNRGKCDRTTGECVCDAGFVGSGCRRMQCPNDCSGHGTCEFMEELASNTFHKRVGGVSGRTYGLWDQEKIMGCVCDANYEGHDCSLRTCPKGDDPLTSGQYEMWQAIVLNPGSAFVAGTSSFYLTYFDPYGNAYTTDKIATGGTFTPLAAVAGSPPPPPAATYNAPAAAASTVTTCSNIQAALRNLPNNVLNTVTVVPVSRFYKFVRTDPKDPTGAGKVYKIMNDNAAAFAGTGDQVSAICEVMFTSEPGTTGYQNLLECNVAAHTTIGQHPMSAGIASPATCDVYEVLGQTALTTTIADQLAEGNALQVRPLSELVECSGRGSCDYTTGTCECFAGHMGLACQKQEALV